MIHIHPDPLSRPEFGASPEAMTYIAAHRRGLAELRKKQTFGKDEQDDDGEKAAPKKKK